MNESFPFFQNSTSRLTLPRAVNDSTTQQLSRIPMARGCLYASGETFFGRESHWGDNLLHLSFRVCFTAVIPSAPEQLGRFFLRYANTVRPLKHLTVDCPPKTLRAQTQAVRNLRHHTLAPSVRVGETPQQTKADELLAAETSLRARSRTIPSSETIAPFLMPDHEEHVRKETHGTNSSS